MKNYRVEFMKTDKKYLLVNIEADSKREAIELAKNLSESDFEEKESVSSHDWKVNKDWSFMSALKSLFN
tara:strand:+ start:3701 stop:3907 length:207 start_codon:yes stop_codon:yes gene_type:complete